MNKNFVYQPPERSGFYLDPRTKLFYIILSAVLIFFVHDIVWLNSILILIPIFLLGSNNNKSIAYAYGVLFFLALFIKSSVGKVEMPYAVFLILGLMSELIFCFSPVVMLIYYMMLSTKPSEFISAMSLWYIPEGIIIPMSMLFRFIPALMEENKSIRFAMRMREMRFGTAKFWKHPLLIFEYRIILLMMSFSRISNELGEAALSSGLWDLRGRTCLEKPKFGVNDAGFGFLAFMLIFCTAVETLI